MFVICFERFSGWFECKFFIAINWKFCVIQKNWRDVLLVQARLALTVAWHAHVHSISTTANNNLTAELLCWLTGWLSAQGASDWGCNAISRFVLFLLKWKIGRFFPNCDTTSGASLRRWLWRGNLKMKFLCTLENFMTYPSTWFFTALVQQLDLSVSTHVNNAGIVSLVINRYKGRYLTLRFTGYIKETLKSVPC